MKGLSELGRRFKAPVAALGIMVASACGSRGEGVQMCEADKNAEVVLTAANSVEGRAMGVLDETTNVFNSASEYLPADAQIQFIHSGTQPGPQEISTTNGLVADWSEPFDVDPNDPGYYDNANNYGNGLTKVAVVNTDKVKAGLEDVVHGTAVRVAQCSGNLSGDKAVCTVGTGVKNGDAVKVYDWSTVRVDGDFAELSKNDRDADDLYLGSIQANVLAYNSEYPYLAGCEVYQSPGYSGSAYNTTCDYETDPMTGVPYSGFENPSERPSEVCADMVVNVADQLAKIVENEKQ